MKIINDAVTSLLDFIDNRAVIRRIVLGVTVWFTYEITLAAWQYAAHSPYDGIGTAAVIAAVTAPFAALQAHAFSVYTKGRAE